MYQGCEETFEDRAAELRNKKDLTGLGIMRRARERKFDIFSSYLVFIVYDVEYDDTKRSKK